MTYWVLAGNPNRYRVIDRVREHDDDWWTTGGRDLRTGDRVAIWKYKGRDRNRGVVALGEVLTDTAEVPVPDGDDDRSYWVDGAEPMPEIAPRVHVRLVRPALLPLWFGQPGSVVNELSVARAQGGTAFRISDEQWERLVAEAGGWPGDDDVSIRSLEQDIDDISRVRLRGQGFAVRQEVRRVVEERAMKAVQEHFEAAGWTVTNVSQERSYDLHCENGPELLRVEVKGMTGGASEIFLTKNEVALAQDRPDASVLAVVSGIRVARGGDGSLRATGGTLHVTAPWHIQTSDLTPLTYRYRIPDK